MPSTARAARWTSERTIEVGDKPVRDPGPDEVRVAVGSAGICGSDLHFYRGEFPATPGITPGHEFGGTVEAVGAGVRHVREGDLVGVEPLLRCGLCPFLPVRRLPRLQRTRPRGPGGGRGHVRVGDRARQHRLRGAERTRRRGRRPGGAARVLRARLREGELARARDSPHRGRRQHRPHRASWLRGPAAPRPSCWPDIRTSRKRRGGSARSR